MLRRFRDILLAATVSAVAAQGCADEELVPETSAPHVMIPGAGSVLPTRASAVPAAAATPWMGAGAAGAGPLAAAPPDAARTPQVVAVAFVPRNVMRIGEPHPQPLVLFDNGFAKASAETVTPGFDVERDRLMNPTQWRRWQHLPDRPLELETSDGGWTRTPYEYEARPLPAGTTLAGSFMFQTSSAVKDETKTVRFAPDGRYAFCDGVEDRAAGLAQSSTRPALRSAESGTYAIDGYLLYRSDLLAMPLPIHSVMPFFYVPQLGALWIGDDYYPDEALLPEKYMCSPPPL